jgi:uncharacterized protein (DUF4415 family)
MLSRAAVRTCLTLVLLAAGPRLHAALFDQEAEETPAAKAQPAPSAKPAAPAKAAPEAKPVAPRPARQLANVRIDVKITDLRGTQPVATKTVSLTVADGEGGSARSTVEAPWGKTEQFRTSNLKVDARPEIDGHKIRLRLTLEYNFIEAADLPKPPVTHVQESITFLLENGQPLVVAESAEPAGDRRVRLEVTATIVR